MFRDRRLGYGPAVRPERRDFWEICEERYQVRSMILTSQLSVSRWHEQIGDPRLADGILDRLVHNAQPHRDAWRFDAEKSREAEHIAYRVDANGSRAGGSWTSGASHICHAFRYPPS